jgi:hypothetical protein
MNIKYLALIGVFTNVYAGEHVGWNYYKGDGVETLAPMEQTPPLQRSVAVQPVATLQRTERFSLSSPSVPTGLTWQELIDRYITEENQHVYEYGWDSPIIVPQVPDEQSRESSEENPTVEGGSSNEQ